MSASACLWEIGKVARAPGRRMRGYGRGTSGRDEWDMESESKKREEERE